MQISGKAWPFAATAFAEEAISFFRGDRSQLASSASYISDSLLEDIDEISSIQSRGIAGGARILVISEA